ncbi:hypothetical protein AVEN_162224-1 [Araneus ventricosus]|uniref:Uncharacterized protein n=1 Tax=Araneus ventricosus TaxID=182803 RepID=A0A4Y2F138_ARAVE|nr:hypothetical protein AVEN_162224-1 [Araneus ventricosus]
MRNPELHNDRSVEGVKEMALTDDKLKYAMEIYLRNCLHIASFIYLIVSQGGATSTWMKSRRKSKWGLVSLTGAIMTWVCTLPEIVRASYERGWAMSASSLEILQRPALRYIGRRLLQTEVI